MYGTTSSSASYSTCVGSFAGYYNSTGQLTALGYAAGRGHATGQNNIYLGDQCGQFGSHSGTGNVFIGSKTVMSGLTSGSYNTVVGALSGTGLSSENYVTALGYNNSVAAGSSYVLMLGYNLTASVPNRIYLGGASFTSFELDCSSIGAGLLQSDANQLISSSTTVSEQISFTNGIKTNTVDPVSGNATTVSGVECSLGSIKLAGGGSYLSHYEEYTLTGTWTGAPVQTNPQLYISIVRTGWIMTLYIQGDSQTSDSTKAQGYFTSSVVIPPQFRPMSDIWKAIIVQDKGTWEFGCLKISSTTGYLYIGRNADLTGFSVGDDINATGFRSIGVSWSWGNI